MRRCSRASHHFAHRIRYGFRTAHPIPRESLHPEMAVLQVRSRSEEKFRQWSTNRGTNGQERRSFQRIRKCRSMRGIDTTFDFHSDTPDGKDPDRYSPTMRRYQQLLWGKALPTGGHFDLSPVRHHLEHHSSLGDFFLASDGFTTRLQKRARRVIREIPDDELPKWPGYTVGSAIVFPSNRVGGMMTINGARGFLAKIADRPDLTVECIRRHYLGSQPNPLGKVLLRYEEFFKLFGDFKGYVEFFLLQDLLQDDGTVRFFHPFDDFKTPAVPKNKDEYLSYLQASIDFIGARNSRIDREP